MRMMIMAGGTGGHVIPALSVARELLKKGVEVGWIGTRHGLEATLVSAEGIEFNAIEIKGLRKSGVIRKLLMPLMLINAMMQAFVILVRCRPNAVLGMGGFASGPGGLVAVLLRLPIILHEQNTVAGITNRWLCKFSKRNLSGFPEAEGLSNFKWIGNPVHPEITNISPPAIRLRDRSGPLRLLVVGGSQGAQVFNESLPQLLGSESLPPLVIRHQCGKNNLPDTQVAYGQLNLDVQVMEFINDMTSAYEWCDLVVCRSGAMTVSEVCSAGVVALFVPYPHAVNDHQASNANYLVRDNAALMVRQDEFLQGEWLQWISRFYGDRNQLLSIAEKARQLSRPNATERVADICMEAMHA